MTFRGAATGFLVGQLPGLAAVALIAGVVDPSFVDAPGSLWLVACLLPGLVGAGIGARLGRGHRAAAPLSVVPALALAALSAWPRGPIPGLKLLVFGVDGATWEQIDPMRADLPAFTALHDDGATGTMTASGPLFSPLLWTALATGRPREEHGVYGFHTRADDVRVPTVWDIADAQGLAVGTMKWLVTWPPPERGGAGFVVPGWTAPSPETFPEDLAFLKQLELGHRARLGERPDRGSVSLAVDGLRHGFRWSTLRDAVYWQTIGRLAAEDVRQAALHRLRARMDRDVFVYELRRGNPAVAALVDYTTDALGHHAWRWHEPAKFGIDAATARAHGDPLHDAYVDADGILAELRTLLPPEGRLVVVSDHGFEALPATTGVRVGPRTDTLDTALRGTMGAVEVARTGARVTVVMREDAEVQALAADQYLATVVRSDTGERLFRWARDPDDPGALVIDLLAPTIPEEALNVDVLGRPLSDWVRQLPDQSGDHTPRGLFAAVGPGVAPGTVVDVGLYDVAPVLLAALGLPRDPAMRGTVPAGLWPDPGTGPSWQPARDRVRFVPVGDEDAGNAMLRELGYVDR